MMDEIVPFMDREQAPILRRAHEGRGLPARLQGGERVEGSTVHYTTKDGAEAQAEADLVLMAVGRRPVVEGWGAREAGLDVSPKGVVVDERMRTNLPGVWAVGDVTGKSLLAHSAYRMADVAVGGHPVWRRRRRAATSCATRRCPGWSTALTEAAGVGMTEQEAAAGASRR